MTSAHFGQSVCLGLCLLCANHGIVGFVRYNCHTPNLYMYSMNSYQHRVTIIPSMYETKVGMKSHMSDLPTEHPCHLKSRYPIFGQIDIPHTCSIIAQLEVLQIKGTCTKVNVYSYHSYYSAYCIADDHRHNFGISTEHGYPQ